jgi:hypothetical protein
VTDADGLRAVLRAHGFDVEGWLERGAKWDRRHAPFDPERARMHLIAIARMVHCEPVGSGTPITHAAARSYSWIRPPSRSRRQTAPPGPGR